MIKTVSSAYTANGFVSYEKKTFPPDCFTYIMKGYPDLAKIKLLEKLSSENNRAFIQYDWRGNPFLVYREDKNICVKDGTYPYSSDVKTYGVSDKIADLSAFCGADELKKQSVRVNDLMSLIKKEERRCERFLLSCAGIINDCKRLEKPNTDSKKINRYCSGLWKRRGGRLSGKIGTQQKIFTTLLNDSGIVRYDEIFTDLCSDIIIITDRTGCAADMIIDKMRLYALSGGYDVITCTDILFPDGVPEHIIIPELKLGICRDQNGECAGFSAFKRVRSKRFHLKETSQSTRSRISFSKKACADLMNEAVASLKKIRFYRDELNGVYSENFDMQGFLNSAPDFTA